MLLSQQSESLLVVVLTSNAFAYIILGIIYVVLISIYTNRFHEVLNFVERNDTKLKLGLLNKATHTIHFIENIKRVKKIKKNSLIALITVSIIQIVYQLTNETDLRVLIMIPLFILSN